LLPKDGKQSRETTVWQGRVRTIDNNVRSIVERSHDSLMRNLQDIKEDNKALEDRIVQRIEDRIVQRMEDEIAAVIKKLDEIHQT